MTKNRSHIRLTASLAAVVALGFATSATSGADQDKWYSHHNEEHCAIAANSIRRDGTLLTIVTGKEEGAPTVAYLVNSKWKTQGSPIRKNEVRVEYAHLKRGRKETRVDVYSPGDSIVFTGTEEEPSPTSLIVEFMMASLTDGHVEIATEQGQTIAIFESESWGDAFTDFNNCRS